MSSRIKSTFGKRSYLSQSQSAYKRYIIAVEGDKTEIDYFKGFNKYRKEMNIRDGVEVLPLERNDTKSAPKHVYDLLNEFAQKHYSRNKNGKLEIDEDDELWMVIDRDRKNNSKSQLVDVLADFIKSDYKLAITNPAFEFWLILHFIRLEDLNLDDLLKLYENKKVSNSNTFCKKFLKKLELVERQKFTYTIENFMLYKNRIQHAISEAKKFQNDVNAILGDEGVASIGTNIHHLIEKFFVKD